MTKNALLAAALIAGSSIAASAHSNEARFEEQNEAIEAGRADGSITWREGIKLRREQAAIARRHDELIADGSLSRSDRRELYRMQDEAQDSITHEANDGWSRLWFLPRFGK